MIAKIPRHCRRAAPRLAAAAQAPDARRPTSTRRPTSPARKRTPCSRRRARRWRSTSPSTPRAIAASPFPTASRGTQVALSGARRLHPGARRLSVHGDRPGDHGRGQQAAEALACYPPGKHGPEETMWVRNAWYVAGWLPEFAPGAIHARTIIDQPHRALPHRRRRAGGARGSLLPPFRAALAWAGSRATTCAACITG